MENAITGQQARNEGIKKQVDSVELMVPQMANIEAKTKLIVEQSKDKTFIKMFYLVEWIVKDYKEYEMALCN